MDRFIGNDIDVASQQFLEIGNQTATVKERRPLAEGHEKINIAFFSLFLAHHGTKNPNVIRPSPSGEGKNFIPIFLEELQARHAVSVSHNHIQRTKKLQGTHSSRSSSSQSRCPTRTPLPLRITD